MRAAVLRFGPPLALMGLIFLLSAQQDLGSGLGPWDLVLRKLAHMTEYAVLFLLWARALPGRPLWAAATIAVSYAVSDELHQSTVVGRHGTAIDVVIDSAGVALAWLLVHRLREQRSG